MKNLLLDGSLDTGNGYWILDSGHLIPEVGNLIIIFKADAQPRKSELVLRYTTFGLNATEKSGQGQNKTAPRPEGCEAVEF